MRKRARTVSSSSSSSEPMRGSRSSLSPSPEPAAKYHRAPSPSREFLCTLPPSCSQPSTSQSFSTQAELDAHHAAFHQHVCRVAVRDKPGRLGEGAAVPLPAAVEVEMGLPEHFSGRHPGGRGKSTRWRECGKLFPDGRLLELHETETHDPLVRERIERGEKIFACFLPPEQCTRTFSTPKKRRWHLVADHKYPKQYFFSITAHGLNQLTRTDGMAASLLRPRYIPPEEGMGVDAGNGNGDGSGNADGGAGSSSGQGTRLHAPPPARAPPRPTEDADMDALAHQMAGLESSLSFIPRNVRRNAKGKQRETRGMDF